MTVFPYMKNLFILLTYINTFTLQLQILSRVIINVNMLVINGSILIINSAFILLSILVSP